jgi:hypothetical protein
MRVRMTNLDKPQTERAYLFYFVKALLCAGGAAFFVGGIFLQSGEIDRLIVGFLAGLVFSFVLAFFDREAKERFGRGFITFPKR